MVGEGVYRAEVVEVQRVAGAAAAEAVAGVAVDGQDLEDVGRGRVVPGGPRMAAEPTVQLNHVHRPGRVAVAAESAGPPGCTQRCPDPLDRPVDPVRRPGGLLGVGEDVRWWRRRARGRASGGGPGYRRRPGRLGRPGGRGCRAGRSGSTGRCGAASGQERSSQRVHHQSDDRHRRLPTFTPRL
jgi:hypothetical protein